MSFPTIPIDDIVGSYKEAMDWLASGTARNVTVHVEPRTSGCLNHLGYDHIAKKALNIYNSGNPFATGVVSTISSLGISGVLNIPFTSGNVCPVCNGDGVLHAPASYTVPARIQWRTADNTYRIRGVQLEVNDQADVRLKVTGTAHPDILDRSKAVEVDGRQCKISKGRIPVGLRDIHTYYYYLDVEK